MNAEQFHDALTLLPGDLITAADKCRTAPQKRIIPWQRYAAMAACLALILYGGFWLLSPAERMGQQAESVMEAPAAPAGVESENKLGVPYSTECDCAAGEAMEEGAPMAPAGDDYAGEPAEHATCPDKFYIGGSSGYSPAPGCKEGMEYPYTAVIRSREELDNWYAEYRDFYDIDSFEAGYAHLDSEFFQQHDLLLVLLGEAHGYVYHEPYYLNRLEGGDWELTFTAHDQQENPTEAPIQWLFFIEIEKDLIEGSDRITVQAEPYAVPEEETAQAHTAPTQ